MATWGRTTRWCSRSWRSECMLRREGPRRACARLLRCAARGRPPPLWPTLAGATARHWGNTPRAHAPSPPPSPTPPGTSSSSRARRGWRSPVSLRPRACAPPRPTACASPRAWSCRSTWRRRCVRVCAAPLCARVHLLCTLALGFGLGHRRGGTARVGWRRSPSKDDAPAPAAALPCTQVRDAQLATLRADGEKAAAKEAQFYDNMRAQQRLEQDARVYRVRGWLCGTARGCGSVPAWCVGTGGGPSLPAALSGLRSTHSVDCTARHGERSARIGALLAFTRPCRRTTRK